MKILTVFGKLTKVEEKDKNTFFLLFINNLCVIVPT